MVALNFKAVFAEPVEQRIKRQSIRMTQRCRVGDALQLYTGMRTKQCRKLSETDPVCIFVSPVLLGPPKASVPLTINGDAVEGGDREQFAIADGFPTYDALYEFFQKTNTAEYICGFLHVWDWLREASN